MYKEDNDYELLYLISEKDECAYNRLYNKYNRLIQIMASRMYRNFRYMGFSEEDVYMAGLYGFYSAIDSFNEKDGVLFYTCAMSFITNEMLSFIRDNTRNKHNVLSTSISLNSEMDGGNKQLLDFISVNDITSNVYNQIQLKNILDLKYDLPILHSLIYELKFNQFTNKEIGMLLDISYKRIDNIIRDIRNKIKKRINTIEEF